MFIQHLRPLKVSTLIYSSIIDERRVFGRRGSRKDEGQPHLKSLSSGNAEEAAAHADHRSHQSCSTKMGACACTAVSTCASTPSATALSLNFPRTVSSEQSVDGGMVSLYRNNICSNAPKALLEKFVCWRRAFQSPRASSGFASTMISLAREHMASHTCMCRSGTSHFNSSVQLCLDY
jgi:hypothetical protein